MPLRISRQGGLAAFLGRPRSYRDVILGDTPVAYLRLADTITTAVDEKGSYNGTYIGVPFGYVRLRAPLVFGNAAAGAYFDGIAGTIQFPPVALGDTFSVECWVQRAAPSGGLAPTLISLSNGLQVGFLASNGPLPDSVTVTEAGVTGAIANSTVPFNDVSFAHHLVLTKAGATIRLYIDGVDVTSAQVNQTLVDGYSTNCWLASSYGAGGFCYVLMQEFALYTKVLTAGQVQAHYLAGAPPGGVGGGPTVPVVPTVAYAAPTNRTSAGFTLNGTVNPNSTATTYHFEYGTTTGYGTHAPASDAAVGSDTTSHTVSQPVGGLAASTLYHYRLVATNGQGVTNGADQTITTSAASGGTYSTMILAETGLVSYYRLGESSGTTATDSKGANNGTYQGTYTLAQAGAIFGDANTAVLFDGISGTVELPAFALGDGPFSVELWVKLTGAQAAAGTCFSGDNGLKFGLTAAPATVFVNQAGVGMLTLSNIAENDTNWHHLVVTKSGSALTLYVDGAQAVGPITNSTLVNGYNANSWLASGYGPGSTTFNKGVLDEVAVYNVVLTENQVQNHYAAGVGATVIAALPAVVVQAATQIVANGASLNGTVNPAGAATTYHFEYGTTTAYGSQTPTPDAVVGSDSSVHQLSQPVSGLAAGAYHYRLVATNASGVTHSNDATFVTPSGPIITLLAPTGVTNTGVTLNDGINPMGVSTSYHFEYGLTAAYGTSIPGSDVLVGSDNVSHNVSQSVTGLTLGTTYHFRVVASNSFGTAYGADQIFVTTGGTAVYQYAPLPLGTQLSSSNCFYYKPLPANASRLVGSHLDSDGVSHTEAQILSEWSQQFAAAYPLVNVNQYTIAILTVPSGMATHAVTIHNAPADLQALFNNCPMPASAVPSGGTDGGFVVWSPSTNTYWDIWGGGYPYPYQGGWGGVAQNCTTLMGAYPGSVRGESWGVSASGLLSACGLPKWEEWVNNLAFHNCIAMSSASAQHGHVYPAWKGDSFTGPGYEYGYNGIPHGTIMRFDPNLSLASSNQYGAVAALGLCPFAAALARAIQTYGMVFNDGGSVVLFAEDITSNNSGHSWWGSAGANPADPAASGMNYGQAYDANITNTVMKQLFSATMMSHLQVIDPAWVQSQGLGG